MVLTTLFLRLRKANARRERLTHVFRSIGLGLVLLFLPLIAGCAAEGDASNGTATAAPTNGKGRGYGLNKKTEGSTTDSTTGTTTDTTTGTTTDTTAGTTTTDTSTGTTTTTDTTFTTSTTTSTSSTTTSGVTSVSVSLAWDAVPDSSVTGYYVYYGTQSPNTSGSCVYQQSQFTTSTVFTVEGLTPGTTYYFAVSAYNGLQSPCSAEVSTVTNWV